MYCVTVAEALDTAMNRSRVPRDVTLLTLSSPRLSPCRQGSPPYFVALDYPPKQGLCPEQRLGGQWFQRNGPGLEMAQGLSLEAGPHLVERDDGRLQRCRGLLLAAEPAQDEGRHMMRL